MKDAVRDLKMLSMLLALKMEKGSTSQGTHAVSRKGKEAVFPLTASRRNRALPMP